MNLGAAKSPPAPPFSKGGCGETFLKGFTLIELLIVIVIISIVASFAALSININQNKRLETIANQLTNVISLAQQEAILRPATLGLVINKNTYQFYEHHPQTDPEKNPWVSMTDSLFELHHLPKDVQLSLKIQGKQSPDRIPQLIISGDDMTPFTIMVGKKDEPAIYKIIGEANGAIKYERTDS